jgi:endonuclease YncB( thermonuclease family)
MDEYGCDEVFDGDSVTVNGYDKQYNVQLYKIDRPRYNPYVI